MVSPWYRSVWTDGAAVSKSSLRDGFRDYSPLVLTATQLRALSTAQAKCVLIDNGAGTASALYVYDSADTTTADDGVSCIVSADGYRYKNRDAGVPELGWVSVKAYGATGDGTTDDTTACQDALTAANNKTCFFPDGTYKLTSPLVIPVNCAVYMSSNCTLLAAAAMDAVLKTDAAAEHLNNVISGGYIDCNDLADSGIWLKYFSMFRIQDVEVWDNLVSGIRLGRSAGTSSYEAFISDCRIRRSLVSAPTGTKGIDFEHCGDSHVSETIIMGQKYGVYGVVNDSKFDRVHVWNAQENGAVTIGFSIGGVDNVLTQCQVDGDCSSSAFYLNGSRNKLLGCATNQVPWGSDLGASCVYVEAGCHATVVACAWKGQSGVRWASDVGLGSGATLDYIGNSAAYVASEQGNLLAGNLTANQSGKSRDSVISLLADAGYSAYLALKTGSLLRWAVIKGSLSESGANAGSDFAINRYSDAGNYIDTPFAINRASGKVTLNGYEPGLRLLTSGTFSSDAQKDLVLTSFTGFRGLALVLTGVVPATDGASLQLLFSSDGGSSYYTTGYDINRIIGFDNSSSLGVAAGGSYTAVDLAGGVGNGSNEGFFGEVKMFGQASNAYWPRCTWHGYLIDNNATPAGNQVIGGAAHETTEDVDALRLKFSAGNIASGSYALYGLI